MTISINIVEALWFALGLTTTILTIIALLNARENQRMVRGLAVPVHVIAAEGIVRREWLRLYKQAVLLGVAVPQLFLDRETPLNYFVVGLMSLQVALLVQSIWDWYDDRRMTALGASAVLMSGNADMAELKRMVREGIGIAQAASDHAEKAYHEANDVNAKIARQGAALVAQGIIQADMADDRETADETAAAMKRTVDTTALQVGDLHSGAAPGKEPT